MAEYVNRDKLLVELECGIRAGLYEKGYDEYMHINTMDDCIDTVKYADAADVVERAEYDLLQSSYGVLKHQLIEALNRINELDKLNGDIREKIDNAIKEINDAEVEVDFMNDYADGFNSGLFKALEILKKNIGEKKWQNIDQNIMFYTDMERHIK